MATPNEGERIKRVTQETSVVVEDALRSIAANIGDIFDQALQSGQDVTRSMVKDVQGGLNSLTKISQVLATTQEKAAKGALTQRDIAKDLESRNIKIAALKAQIAIAEQNGVKNAIDLKEQLYEIEEQEKLINSTLKEQLDYSNKIQKAMGLTGTVLSGVEKISRKLGLSGLDTVFGRARDAAQAKAKALVDAGKNAGSLGSKIKTLAAGLKGLASGLKEMFTPEILIGGLFGAISKLFSFISKKYTEGKAAAERISEENTQVARTLGLAQGAASKLANSVAGIGPTVAASKQSVTQLYSAMGSTEKLSANTLKVFIKLNTFAGMSADSLAKFQAFAKASGQDAGTMVKNMADVALQVIKTNKLAISQKKLLEDTAAQSNTIKLQFRAQPQELLKAVAQSKKLGLELSKVEDIANSLLNIEDSIAAEMEAELMTGKDLNLEKAREAALNNDSKTLMSEIADQFGSINDFQNMNRAAQESFAKSIGLSRDGLSDMLMEAEKNKSAQGDLVDGQQDGLKALQSSVSEAEANANVERRKQESSIAFYKELAPLVRELSDIFSKIKSTLSGLFTDLVIKPMIEWFNSSAGKAFIESLPEKAESFAKFIERGAKAIGEGVTKLTAFIKENPWLSTIAAVATTSTIGMAVKAISALKGATPATAMWVRLAGGKGITDMFKSKPSASAPKLDPKTGRYRDPSTGRFTKAPAPQGGGGGFFSNIGKKISNSSVGKFVSSTASKAGNLVAKANPLNLLKKGLTSNAGKFIGKAVKGGLIGTLLNVGSLAAILASQGTPLEKASQIIPAAASILGGALGSIAGSIVGPVGTFGVGFLGSLIGDWIGSLPAVQKALAPPLAKALGGEDVAEDFIMQGGKIQKFRKDDIVMGGTNLMGGDPKMIALLERLVTAVEKGGIVTIDGQKVGQALVLGSYRTQ